MQGAGGPQSSCCIAEGGFVRRWRQCVTACSVMLACWSSVRVHVGTRAQKTELALQCSLSALCPPCRSSHLASALPRRCLFNSLTHALKYH